MANFLNIKNPNAQMPFEPTTNVKANSAGNVYWVGQDGNVYIRGTDGRTSNVGALTSGSANGFEAARASGQAQRINDPNPGNPSATRTTGTNTTQVTGGGGAGTEYTDTSAARAATQSSIDSLQGILANKMAQAQGEYDELMGAYITENADNEASYNKKVETNEGTREAQQQAALIAAANGGRGLYSALASIGALGGTGKLLANRAVSNEANLDLGEANKTFDTNAGNLFDAYGALKKQEEQRKLEADTTLKKTKQQNEYDVAQTRQGLYKDMADLWTKAGNNGEAANSLARYSAENANLVANTRPNVGTYARTPLQYQAPALEGYLAGANDMSVNTSGGGQLPINGAIYTSTKKRDKAIA